MNHHKPPPSRHRVNWENPDLKSLLEKTEGWNLDNRGVFERVACEVHVGWGAAVTRPATLVYESGGVLVFEANFLIPQGENVRIDYVQADGGDVRSRWGTVADARAGRRADDEAHGTQVYWLHVR
ncbi:hypothetical protein [Rhodanobacter ginsengiterrae]|uniref:hypothetical protein n=1 Tax=Rhodanobacter ginsengiterrae TaxID=2008451 RepID=UPI003CFB7FEB